MYVARYTFDPHYDIERGWTAWIDPQGDTPEQVADLLIDTGRVELPRRLREAYWDGDVDAAIAYVLDNYDIRFHERAGKWMLVHHDDGLSCWPLQAETLDAAIDEARARDAAGDIGWHGFGHYTRGCVRYVASISDTLHIFECGDVSVESW